MANTISQSDGAEVIRNPGAPLRVRGVATAVMFVTPEGISDEELQRKGEELMKSVPMEYIVMILEDLASGAVSYAALSSKDDVNRLIKALQDLRDKMWSPVLGATNRN